MKSKRLVIGIAVALVVVVAAIFLEPTGVVRGFLEREAFFSGRPVTYWRNALGSQDPAFQAEATRKLQEGGQAAIPVLAILLKEKKTGSWEAGVVRWKAADILGQLGAAGGDGVPALMEALQDDDPHVRTVAATSLGNLAPTSSRAMPDLGAQLAAGDSASIAAARALSRFGAAARSTIPDLLQALKAKDGELRWNAARTLGKIGPDARETVPALVAAFQDPDPLVREHAAEALGDIGPEARDGVPALIAILKDPVARVRRDAARSLGQIGPAARLAVPALKDLEKDKDADVAKTATKALRILGPGSAKETTP